MPRLPINYANTIIYKIVCNDLNITECYVGHTTDFVCRKQCHKKRCINKTNKKHNSKLYKVIRSNGGWENYSMIEIEKFPCQDVNEAKKKERECFENHNSSLNTNFPQRSKKEYYIDNKDEMSIKNKTYNLANKEKIADHKKVMYEINRLEILEKHKTETFICECGRLIKCCNRSRHSKSKVHNDNIKSII
jgi:hypothetical protein